MISLPDGDGGQERPTRGPGVLGRGQGGRHDRGARVQDRRHVGVVEVQGMCERPVDEGSRRGRDVEVEADRAAVGCPPQRRASVRATCAGAVSEGRDGDPDDVEQPLAGIIERLLRRSSRHGSGELCEPGNRSALHGCGASGGHVSSGRSRVERSALRAALRGGWDAQWTSASGRSGDPVAPTRRRGAATTVKAAGARRGQLLQVQHLDDRDSRSPPAGSGGRAGARGRVPRECVRRRWCRIRPPAAGVWRARRRRPHRVRARRLRGRGRRWGRPTAAPSRSARAAPSRARDGGRRGPGPARRP